MTVRATNEDFTAACTMFDRELLAPLERLTLDQPFLAMYVASALVETLAGANLQPSRPCTRQSYKEFVRTIDGYDEVRSFAGKLYDLPTTIYHVVRCGLLHGSRLDALTATPPSSAGVLPVGLHSALQPPEIKNGSWLIGVPHFIAAFRKRFELFSRSSDADCVQNFPIGSRLT